MRRTVLLLASVSLAVLFTSGVVTAQEEDTTPPETTISEWDNPGPYSRYTSASFSFSSSEPNSTFECKIDSGSFEPCASPKSYYSLLVGQHTFAVRAKDAAGNVDPTPAEYTWEVDRTAPKITWLEKPGNHIDRWSSITDDTTPTWAYAFSDKNLSEYTPGCSLSPLVTEQPCPSPMTFPFELPDGRYYFSVDMYDKAGNWGYGEHYLEVDTVAPKFVSGKPTGTSVGRYAEVVVTFDDRIYNSNKFVNIYKKGTSTPLAVSRYGYSKKITISPKNALKRGTWYTVKVTTGVNDGANKLAAPKTWHFKTRG